MLDLGRRINSVHTARELLDDPRERVRAVEWAIKYANGKTDEPLK